MKKEGSVSEKKIGFDTEKKPGFGRTLHECCNFCFELLHYI